MTDASFRRLVVAFAVFVKRAIFPADASIVDWAWRILVVWPLLSFFAVYLAQPLYEIAVIVVNVFASMFFFINKAILFV